MWKNFSTASLNTEGYSNVLILHVCPLQPKNKIKKNYRSNWMMSRLSITIPGKYSAKN